MPVLQSKPWRQRLNKAVNWPRWLLNPRVLRGAISIGIAIFRLWQFWQSLTDRSDG